MLCGEFLSHLPCFPCQKTDKTLPEQVYIGLGLHTMPEAVCTFQNSLLSMHIFVMYVCVYVCVRVCDEMSIYPYVFVSSGLSRDGAP